MKTTTALVGPIASGKGAIAEILVNKGYVHFQYGDEVRKEVANRGLEGSREVLQEVSDSLRYEFGPDILARRMAASIDELRDQGKAEKAIIDGLRHPAEVSWVKQNYHTHVIGINIPPEIRYQRLIERNRPTDPKSLEGFISAEQRDRGIGQPDHGNQVEACLKLADILIINDGSRENLEKKLNETLISLGIEGFRNNKERK